MYEPIPVVLMKIANGHKASCTFMMNCAETFLRYTSGFLIAKIFTNDSAKYVSEDNQKPIPPTNRIDIWAIVLISFFKSHESQKQ